MRFIQFLLTLINLGASIFLLIVNLASPATQLRSSTFLWCLIYVTIAVSLCHLYVLYMVNKIDDWYDEKSMKGITDLAIICIILSFMVLVTYLVLDYLDTKSFYFIFENGGPLRHPSMPLACITVSSLFLFSSSIKFKNYVILCRSSEVVQPAPRIRPNYRTTDFAP